MSEGKEKFVASFSPTRNRILRKLHLVKNIETISAERIEVHSAETVDEKPAIALSGEFSRIRKTRHNLTSYELASLLDGGKTDHGPTIAYRYKNALLADGSVYVGHYHQRIATRPKRKPIILGNFPEYEKAMLCADVGSDVFFGRWLCDSLAKEILAEEWAMAPINQKNILRIHETGYRSILGMEAIFPNVARISDLWMIDDRGYNSDHVRRFKKLRSRLRVTARAASSNLVYLGRGVTGVPGRDLQNECEIMEALTNLGASEIIHPENTSTADIVRALAAARIVVAIEGSALAHAMLAMAEGSTIITIQPANRFSTALKSVSEFAGIRFSYIVAEQADERHLWLDENRLLRLIELVENSMQGTII